MPGNFKLISIIVCIVLGVLGVLVFSGAIPIGKKSADVARAKIVMWGTVRSNVMDPILSGFNDFDPNVEVKYIEKSPDAFNRELLEGIASGSGPDIFLLPDNLVLDYKNKIYPVPYESYPVATYKNAFASAGDVFLTREGILAFPIYIDPIVMYYNRSMLDAGGIVYPPADWDQFVSLIPTLNKKDGEGKIIKSTVALGQYSNITHAKEILATLFMQTGNPITLEDENGVFYSTLGQNYSSISTGSILDFYTSFANPLRGFYSWNKLFPASRDFFASNSMAFYFGFASERNSLVNTNPNLNFGVAVVPQIKNSNLKSTGASVMGIAVSNYSQNLGSAVSAAGALSAGDFAQEFASTLGVAPARRDLLAIKPSDEFNPVYYSSALYARSWLDPSYEDTDTIFRAMVDKVLSNNTTAEDSVKDASARLNLLLGK